MESLAPTRRRPRLALAAVLLALAYSAVTSVTQPQPAAAASTFSQPVTGVVWQAGRAHSIVWTGGAPGRQPLTLMRGSSTARQQVLQIAVVEGSSGTYDWTPPADLPTDDTYAIALGRPPEVGYTGRFTITHQGEDAPAPPAKPHRAPAPAPAPRKP
ncbi:GPI anchored serine-threonine rich family protein [Streptomyces sp. NPDC098789]|uniref:GPI anchored serine-threonine rich family protein n=1 Tax=Streptomyces sp. NPDC098789 TaxID=3366098 RepID=UPI0038205EF0